MADPTRSEMLLWIAGALAFGLVFNAAFIAILWGIGNVVFG